MNKDSSATRALRIVLILLLTTIIFVFVGFKLYTGKYYKADEEMIAGIAEEVGDSVSSYTSDSGTVFLPKKLAAKAVVVFYPGGKVEYTAYSGLMYELSDKGYICIIPRMTGNLAFLNIDAIDDLRKSYAEDVAIVNDLDWYLAGHSLGGVAACSYLADKAKNEEGDLVAGFKGIILCASYPASSLADTKLRLISIRGSDDGVLNMENYEESRGNWPANSVENVIQGGIHSYFGCYGIQEGDGTPAITNREQLDMTADIIDEWISQ